MIGSHLGFETFGENKLFVTIWLRFIMLKNIYFKGAIVYLCQIEAELEKIIILTFRHFPRPIFWKWPQELEAIYPHFLFFNILICYKYIY